MSDPYSFERNGPPTDEEIQTLIRALRSQRMRDEIRKMTVNLLTLTHDFSGPYSTATIFEEEIEAFTDAAMKLIENPPKGV